MQKIPQSLHKLSVPGLMLLFLLAGRGAAHATPANRLALDRYYGKFLAKSLNACTTCHLPSTTGKAPTSLSDFPHNPFGARLRQAAAELAKAGRKTDIGTRLAYIAREDSDGDGVDNETELLLGHAPGDAKDRPTPKELLQAAKVKADFAAFLKSYRWQPFETVHRPKVPKVKNAAWVRNPVDAFLADEHDKRGLKPRPPASKAVLLRRVYIDLIGLSPTPEELREFENDKSPDAYEKVVDRLLASPRYGERWGRHWMDVWRYSDWAGWADGGQVRDSKPHIWRWRDWIVESLNKDKGYDRMAQEMLAADELCPKDTDALRATGYLVRNFKLLSREQWLEETMTHTSKAFLGLTMGCAKCHDHMYDPITANDYYRMRAIFEPHNVRTDRIPGQPDTAKDGLVHVFDADPDAKTYFFPRGDEHNPDKSKAMLPGIPASLGGAFTVVPVSLPRLAHLPDKRPFVIQETIAASQQNIETARKTNETTQADAKATPLQREIAKQNLAVFESRHRALLAVLSAEKLEDEGKKDSEDWKQAATQATTAQREAAAIEAKLNVLNAKQKLVEAEAKANAPQPGDDKNLKPPVAALEEAKKQLTEAEKALTAAENESKAAPTTAYKPRPQTEYPAVSTGRRLAFARWLTDRKNPLTARVAMNQIWMRHFGQGIVPSVADFGRNGRAPSHPQLLDWLASEFMARNWQMKPMHRLLVTSSAYRMASTPDTLALKRDPDNVFLWRMSSRRMEAEVVRDNVLSISGQLDLTMGGPEVDHNMGLVSRRRSLYLRIAAEKEVEFLKIFDGPSVTECYERKPSVMPQQALALANSELVLTEARRVAGLVSAKAGADNARYVEEAFLRVLTRRPTPAERKECLAFLSQRTAGQSSTPQTTALADKSKEAVKPAPDPLVRARENLLLVLFNHNDFVTVR